ncbi:hypothetical protein DDK22_36405 [Cupriavidus necator]|uniref:Uncharacterized protein n=2 Tax=Cupriavidus necator TaxID=106590 RepID=A0A367P7R7_CUPNE|nr:hypothetical protein DDK22_36405 [Cupriavidus necator]
MRTAHLPAKADDDDLFDHADPSAPQLVSGDWRPGGAAAPAQDCPRLTLSILIKIAKSSEGQYYRRALRLPTEGRPGCVI